MIGNLLKQLWKAIGVFIRYHLSRLFGRQTQQPPGSRPDPNLTSMAETIPTVELDPVYRKTIAWRTDRNDVMASGTVSNPIFQLWRGMPQGHKWTH